MHATELHYDRHLIRQAVRGYWLRVTGVPFLFAIVLTAVGFVAMLGTGNRSWLVGVVGSVLVLGIAFSAALFVVPYRGALERLTAMGDPTGTLEVTESSLNMTSGAGIATVPWSAVIELWTLPSCLLLFFSRSQFITLPLADLPPEMAEFIRSHLRAAGRRTS